MYSTGTNALFGSSYIVTCTATATTGGFSKTIGCAVGYASLKSSLTA